MYKNTDKLWEENWDIAKIDEMGLVTSEDNNIAASKV